MSKPDDTYDAIVVGAGPAGSLYSYLTARAGLKVLLIDKSYFPRPKVCGDTLNAHCWDIWKKTGLETGFRKLPCHIIKEFSLSSENSPPVTLSYESRDGSDHRAVSRDHLDDWLREEAIAAGATCRTSLTPNSFDAPASIHTPEGSFHGSLAVAADGRNSWLARAAGFSVGKARCRRVAWQTTIPSHFVDQSIHMKFFEEGYLGVTRITDESANLCMVINRARNHTPQRVAARFFPGLPACSWRSVTPLSRGSTKAAQDKVLLLGDAARVVEPFTGEGIYFALESARRAADLTIRHWKAGDFSHLSAAYRRSHRLLYCRLSYQNRLTRTLAQRPSLGVRAARFLNAHPGMLRLLTRGLAPVSSA
jgi:flavin-dependent dehydrogenase